MLKHPIRLAALFIVTMIPGAHAAPFVLTNGSGDAKVTVGVDGYGSFGSSIGLNAENATYDPVGAIGPAGTTFESAVAIRFNRAGGRSFLTSGNIVGVPLPNTTVTGSSTSGSSSFSFGGLNFALTQTLTPLFSGGSQTGTVLTQTYVISNPGIAGSVFELVRYMDGDLQFDGSIQDGGGRIVLGTTEVLFQTDTATGTATSPTFVGITGEGGVAPASGRFEIASLGGGLRARIFAGTALGDVVNGDGPDGDQIIDADDGYDVSLALLREFEIAAGGSATYVTRTIFGAGEPEDVRPEAPGTEVPAPATIGLLGLAAAGLAARRRRCRSTPATPA